jgi:DNA polymerase-3 subunit gamma/tau
MAAVLQTMAVLQAVPQRAAAPADAEAAEAARLADAMPADETQLLYSICLHGRGELGLAPDEYAALTMVLLRLLAFKPSGAATAEKKTLKKAAPPVEAPAPATALAAVKPAPVPAPAPRPVAPPQAEPEVLVDPDGDGDIVVPAGTDIDPVETLPEAPAPMPVAVAVAAPVAPAQDDSDPPPFYDEGDPGTEDFSRPVAPAVRPPLAALQVRENGARPSQPSQQLRSAESADVMAVPVRQQPLAGARTGPRADVGLPTTFTPTDEGEVWFTTVRSLVRAEAITALVRELALQSQLVARDGKHWMLRLESASLNTPNSRERLRAALEAAGHADMLSVEVGTVVDSPARRNAAAAAARQRKAEEIVTSDPFVQEMMRDFGAKIVPGTLKVRPLQDSGAPA